MKFNFKFNNLLGTVYRKGNFIFTSDGNSLISPVGNRITIYDLKNNKSTTLPVESDYNFTTVDLSPNGCILIAINEEGEAYMISLVSCTVLHKYRFQRPISFVKFSPDGKHFAVCKENNVFIMKAPGPFTGEYNPFVMERVFRGALDDTSYLEWSSCSRLLAVGSKDMCTRIYALDKFQNFKSVLLGGHSQAIVGCFFEKDNFDITTLSQNGQLCIWECSIDPNSLEVYQPNKKKRKTQTDENEEDDIDDEKAIEQGRKSKNAEEFVESYEHIEDETRDEDGNLITPATESESITKFAYKKNSRHYLADLVKKENPNAFITTTAYHKETKILVTGFSTGTFFLHELPDVNLIHSLSISEYQISSISISPPGDWIALGCSGIGQLLVWEWQSEQYVMKQQGHSTNITCLCYSPDGQYIVTGGHDGKVKLWNTTSGFCFVTFSEHTSSVTSIQFSTNKKFFISSSLDGTVRCFDITRYRNFKTLTSPTPVQFSCVALDSSGELCAAGGQDVFEIFVWSIKLGKLLEILGGHEAPVVSLCFSPLLSSTALASASWDKTLRLWNCIETGSDSEVINLNSDALQVVYRPDGLQVAICTLNGQICIFDTRTFEQVKIIDGRSDLGSGRSDTDLITAEKSLKAKAFTSICYSADGQCILAGGQSKNICIYSIQEAVLLKKIQITQNKSLDSMMDFVSKKNLTEFGNLMLVEKRTNIEGGDIAVRLPGVRQGDMADRNIKPEVRVFSAKFSPTGQSFSVATTEGLMQFTLGTGNNFQPFELKLNVTPQYVKKCLQEENWGESLMSAIQLNDSAILVESIEKIPFTDIYLTIQNIPDEYLKRLLKFLANMLEESPHVELYLRWIQSALTVRGTEAQRFFPMSTLLALEKCLTTKYNILNNICDFNKYTIQHMKHRAELICKKEDVGEEMDVDVQSDSESESSGRGTGSSDNE